jgi:hypothetical protein
MLISIDRRRCLKWGKRYIYDYSLTSNLSVAPRGNQKLSYRYFGPFSILSRIGQVAYRWGLPDIYCIHLVVHVSQLKRHIPPQAIVEEDIGSPDDPMIAIQSVHFVASRMIQKGAFLVSQI